MSVSKPEIHPGNANRLNSALEDFSLTMQHAVRDNIRGELERRAADEAGVLPPLTAAEMFDYLVETDPEFYNWLFPFCAVHLTSSNLGYIHKFLVEDIRKRLTPAVEVVQTESE